MVPDNNENKMTFHELLNKCGIPILAQGGNGDPVISDITNDSRSVTPGALYVAVPGTKVHGDQFIAQAIAQGAVAILSENRHPEQTVPWIQAEGVRYSLGLLGMTFWDVCMNDRNLVGITGTNGKTTIAHLYEALYALSDKQEKTWMFGTIENHIGTGTKDATHTTPEALHIIREIGQATVSPSVIIMEVSSHSLALDRIGGLSFDVVVFTNLTQDHLDFHTDMESYFRAKQRLFTHYIKTEGCAIINIDDPYGKRLVASVHGGKCFTYGRAADADVRIVAWECDWDGCKLDVVYQEEIITFTSRLRGFFNIYNMAALVTGAFAKGFAIPSIQRAFDRVPVVPGRMERVIPDAPYTVIIDYAHTPDALLNVLRTARELTRGRLLCVFGCGGDRDRTKRPLMGAAVAELCDEAWITSDNPRSEKPMSIINEIIEGIPLDFPHFTQPDRREAIGAALRGAQPGDCLVIAGKGHETYQEIKGVRHHFDDKEVVAEWYISFFKG